MNPNAVVIMWLLTLIFVAVLVVAPAFVWIPLVVAALYVSYAIFN